VKEAAGGKGDARQNHESNIFTTTNSPLSSSTSSHKKKMSKTRNRDLPSKEAALFRQIIVSLPFILP
jgi:hypothetical protein